MSIDINQFVKMMQDSNRRMETMMKAITSGTEYDRQAMEQAAREYEDQIKQFNMMFPYLNVMLGKGKGASALKKMNIMDETTAIDTGVSAEDGKVNCPIRGLISAKECLDISGTHDECPTGCEIGKEVKQTLIDRRDGIYAS